MITVVNEDITKAVEKVICHQVNSQGRFNSGVARAIRYAFPEAYSDYIKLCNNFGLTSKELLGNVCWSESNGKLIGNLFGQEYYGYDGQQYTSYEALKNCFKEVRTMVATTFDESTSIAMPYMIGCVRGGGDWNVVQKMIDDIFQNMNSS